MSKCFVIIIMVMFVLYLMVGFSFVHVLANNEGIRLVNVKFYFFFVAMSQVLYVCNVHL